MTQSQIDYYCVFCGSEMDIKPEDDEAVCEPCNATFELYFEEGCLRGFGIKSCGKECTCVKNNT